MKNNDKQNLLIYLHGKGADKNKHSEFVQNLAIQENADALAFNAPLLYKQGYSWFTSTIINDEKNVSQDDFDNSIEYIMNKVTNTAVDYKNIIICGHSQGAAMALAIGMLHPFKKVISICGDLAYNLNYQVGNPSKNIIWIEGAKDTYLTDYRKKSFSIIKDKNIDFHYILSTETQHDCFSPDLLQEIVQS